MGGFTKEELIIRWQDTMHEAVTVITHTNLENLLRDRVVQGSTHSGIGIIIHVTEHYSYHTGQIIFLTKLYKNVDMGFYKGVKLNQRNA